uniref:Phosphoinositide 3-kinase regulatory subunit 5 n=1 Tax=Petromyzon marinus TaxID=7757 RepID=S4R547_PETMA
TMEKPTTDQFWRLQHLVERCLHDLEKLSCTESPKNAGLALNRWTLEELMSRHPSNGVLVIRQILDKLRELHGTFNHDGFVPLALMFWSTAINTPHIPQDKQILNISYEEFCKFLTWPQPAGGLCKNVLHFIKTEMRAPGITFQRLAQAENEISSNSCLPNAKTVLLLDPAEVPQGFSETVKAELKLLGLDRQSSTVKLIRHVFQSTGGREYDLDALQKSLQTKDKDFVHSVYLRCVSALEKADSSRNDDRSSGDLGQQLHTIYEEIVGSGKKGTGENNSTLEFIPLPLPKILVHDWKDQNLVSLDKSLVKKVELVRYILGQTGTNDQSKNVAFKSCHLTGAISPFTSYLIILIRIYVQQKKIGKALATEQGSGDVQPFRDSGFSSASISSGSWPERESACETQPRDDGLSALRHSEARLPSDKRPDSGYSENELPLLDEDEPRETLCCRGSIEDDLSDNEATEECSSLKITSEANKLKRKTAMRRKLQLRDEKAAECRALRIVVFGRDKTLGRLARAYNRMRIRESRCSLLMKHFRLEFYYIPIRDRPPSTANPLCGQALNQQKSGPYVCLSYFALSVANRANSKQDQDNCVISQTLGVIDTWYERNVGNAFSIMTLLPSQVCTFCHKQITQETNGIAHYPFWANTVLYYSRFAKHSVLLQAYQMELCLINGKKVKEIFVQEMLVTPQSSRQTLTAAGQCRRASEFDKEPSVSLSMAYDKVSVSKRVQTVTVEKNFTSVKISRLSPLVKAALEANLDTLYLITMEPAGKQTRMLPFVTQIRNPPIRVNAVSLKSRAYSTLTVMLDNDESKVFQDVISCAVSACLNPEHSLLKRQHKTSKVNPGDCHPFLGLPISLFSVRTL